MFYVKKGARGVFGVHFLKRVAVTQEGGWIGWGNKNLILLQRLLVLGDDDNKL